MKTGSHNWNGYKYQLKYKSGCALTLSSHLPLSISKLFLLPSIYFFPPKTKWNICFFFKLSFTDSQSLCLWQMFGDLRAETRGAICSNKPQISLHSTKRNKQTFIIIPNIELWQKYSTKRNNKHFLLSRLWQKNWSEWTKLNSKLKLLHFPQVTLALQNENVRW